MKLYLCEKPDQASHIADGLGGKQRRDGYYDTAGGRVTWCFGHMLEQAAPEDYNLEWKSWNLNILPIRPPVWKNMPVKEKAKQLKVIQQLLKDATELVIATDAGREGEMIAREILDQFSYRGLIQRLWLSALDTESIKRALAKLRPGRETEPLYRAALARSRADWLVGLNLTRAATVALGNGSGVLSVGRVQTPTLALVVKRDVLIDNFKPRDFYELVAEVTAGAYHLALRHAPAEEDRLYNRADAEALSARAQGARGPLAVASEHKHQAPPKLFELLKLQGAANKLWGWSAQKTLDVAQALYETHKATTYPRTDCPYLPNEQEADVPVILQHLAGVADLGAHAQIETPEIRKSIFNTKKITEHHAIIPTTATATWSSMNEDERALYLLIARHYLAALHPDHEYQETRISFDANGIPFKTSGRAPLVAGWKAVFGADLDDEDDQNDKATPALPPVQYGAAAEATRVTVDARRTSPPARYTEKTLLEDMAAIAKYVDDAALKARLKETSGIGTNATRAAILETLKKRGFLVTKGKSILSSDTGRALIQRLPAGLADPGETALWEDRLEAIVAGQESVEGFLTGIDAKVAALVGELRNVETAVAVAADAPSCPLCEKPMRRRTGKNGSFWGCSAYPECRGTRNDESPTPSTNSVPPARAKKAPVKKKATARR